MPGRCRGSPSGCARDWAALRPGARRRLARISPPRLAAPGAVHATVGDAAVLEPAGWPGTRRALGWRPLLAPETALDWTADGYRRLDATADTGFIAEQIARFGALATTRPETAVDADLCFTLDRGRGLGRLPMPMPMPQRKASHAATLA